MNIYGVRLVERSRRVKKIDSVATGMLCRKARKLNLLSLREVARRMKISPAYLSDLERGQRNWTAKQIANVNRAFVI